MLGSTRALHHPGQVVLSCIPSWPLFQFLPPCFCLDFPSWWTLSYNLKYLDLAVLVCFSYCHLFPSTVLFVCFLRPCNSGWLGIHYLDQTGLKWTERESPTSASQVLGLFKYVLHCHLVPVFWGEKLAVNLIAGSSFINCFFAFESICWQEIQVFLHLPVVY